MNIDLGTDWREWQKQEWGPVSKANYSIEVVHRGAGKSVFALMRLLGWALERSGSTAAYIGPQQKQVRAYIWPLMKRLYGQVPGASFNETELRADLPGGSRILCLGSENAHSIRGATLDGGVVLDEVAQIGPVAWGQVIYPAVNRPGVTPRVIMIGTPLGMSNLFYEMYEKAADTPGWHRCYLPVTATNLYSEEELERLKRETNPSDFAQEFMCDWSASVRGAYFGEAMAKAEQERRIGNVPHDPLLAVHTGWDLGINDLTVIWYYQVAGAEVRCIDLQAFQSTGLPEIISRMPKHYRYGRHYAPHDAKVRELGSGKSRQEIALSLGVSWEIVPEVGLMSGIESARGLLPRCWFDRTRCKDGIEALKTYRTEYDDVHRVYSLKPLHSWESHYADSFRYFAVGSQGKHPDYKPIQYRDKVVA
jgi:phage terminase large subunit